LLSANVFGRSTPTSNSINVTITNSSQKDIKHVYVAVGSPDNWGPDCLNSAITTGGSFTVNGIACDGSTVRVIAEDQNGCFYYNNVSCDGNATWTISDNSTADCGG
jgi:hypothetical protein